MKPWMFGALTLAVAGLATASSTLVARQAAPRQENQPGLPTIARMYILNREPSEAVPVSIQNTGDMLPVVVAGVPTVTLAPTTAVATRVLRQSWEYRQFVAGPGEDVTTALNALGADGWEAVGAMNRGASSQAIILKRPK